MTIEQAKQKLLLWLNQQVGYHEGGNNYNKYAEGMDSAYGWHIQNQPWCDIFADVAYVSCFGMENAARMTYQPVGGFSAGCAVSASYYRQHNALMQRPEVGDQIFFYSGGGINHTGIVVRVSSGTVETIEGNSSDSVARRSYSIGASNIAGYGRPDWSVVATSDDSNEPSEDDSEPKEDDSGSMVTVELPVLRNGMGGNAVAALQGVLFYQGYNLGPDGVDGELGVKTYGAVRNFQIRHDLEADGIVGEQTWHEILKSNF